MRCAFIAYMYIKQLMTTAKLKTTLEIPNYHDQKADQFKYLSNNNNSSEKYQNNWKKRKKKFRRVYRSILQNIQGNLLQGVEIKGKLRSIYSSCKRGAVALFFDCPIREKVDWQKILEGKILIN